MANGFTGLEVDPHLGIVLNRWVRYQPNWISVMEMLHMSVTSGEHRAMDRRSEQLRTAVGKRRGEAVEQERSWTGVA